MRGRTAAASAGAAVLALLLAACAGSPEIKDASPPGKAGLEAAAELAVSDPETLIEKLADWSIAGFIVAADEATRAADLASAAAAELDSRLAVALSERDWRQALKDFSSLKTLARLEGAAFVAASVRAGRSLERSSEAAILLGEAGRYRDAGLYAPAISTLFLALAAPGGEGLLDPQAREAWISYARKAGDLFSAEALSPGKGAEGRADFLPPALKDVAKAVVTVYVDKGLKFENGVGYPDRVLGSAFQIDPAGYYLSNYHVVKSEVDPSYEGYSRLSLRPADRPEARVPAKVVGWNKALDLALVKSEAGPSTIHLKGGAAVERGDRVFAIGSPVGLENSMSSGIVSATGRRILERGEALQIDVPVNPGSSGGPLLTAEGRLAGLVFAGLSDFQGLNFALPTPWIASAAARLFDPGESPTASLGLAAAKNLDGSLSLSYVFPNTPGFRQGDKILSLDGKPVTSLDQAQLALAAMPLGSLCLVEIQRGEKRFLMPRKTIPLADGGLGKAFGEDSVENLFAGAAGLLIEHFAGPRGGGGSYKVLRAWPGMAGDESGISEGDSLLLLRGSADQKTGSLSFDLQIKTPSKGYLERTMRLTLPMEMDNFL